MHEIIRHNGISKHNIKTLAIQSVIKCDHKTQYLDL